MSDIQRYTPYVSGVDPVMEPESTGEWVTYADHLAALRACEQRVLDAARAAVEALEPLLDVEKRNGGYDCCGCTTPGKLLADALAAIDALREKP